MTGAPAWFAVQTHPRAEEKALGHLRRQGYRAYLPRYAKLVRHARKTSHVTRPLFPGYLFVAFDPEVDRWRPIRSTHGVIDIVHFGDRPTPLPAGLIDGLIELENAEGCIPLVQQPSYMPGSAVVVTAGPFARCLGLYEGITESERVAILLELLGRRVRVVLDPELIEAA